MKVQQLFLRDVRSIKSLDLDFRDPVTGRPMSRIVLAGANGSGKTTILESIFALLSAVEEWREPINLPAHARLQLLVEIDFPANKPVTLSISYNDPIAADEGLFTDGLVGGPSAPFLRPREIEERAIKPLPFNLLAESIRAATAREGVAPGSALYFPHDRYLSSVSQGELGFEPRVYQWSHKYKASEQWKGSTESYLFSLNYLDLEDRDRKVPANRFGQIVEVVNSVLDGKKITRIEKGRVVIETTDGQTHGLGDLSSGEKQIVLLLVEISRRIVPGSVILIDEPEISFHPAWHRGLVVALDKIIEQYDAQVIMATHSPEIAGMVLPHEVKFLSDLDVPLGEWKPENEVLA